VENPLALLVAIETPETCFGAAFDLTKHSFLCPLSISVARRSPIESEWRTTDLITPMRCLSECHNRPPVPYGHNEPTPNHLRTRFAEPERKQPAASSSPSLTPSHYDTKPAPARPQDAYGRSHPSPAGRLSPSGHGPYGATMSPPPPTGGPRPNPVQNRPPPISRPPPSPAPNEGGADSTLLPLFRAVDKDRTFSKAFVAASR
jgi:hypothetical protein